MENTKEKKQIVLDNNNSENSIAIICPMCCYPIIYEEHKGICKNCNYRVCIGCGEK